MTVKLQATARSGTWNSCWKACPAKAAPKNSFETKGAGLLPERKRVQKGEETFRALFYS
jgi:hypothetical protein